MVHGNIIKQGLYGDSTNPVKAGMPVAIKNVDGKGVIVPYSVTDNAFIGVAIEDTIVYDESVEGAKNYTPSVSYEGQIDCIAGGALTVGDKVKPTANGFEKDTDGTATVGVVLKGAAKKGDWATVLFI
ncbi:phage capsid protein [Brachyspira pilosicoli]|uniref:phage capsid protein n=1 Tax=Brachyspira pilosicoli TaxID=52584 RepID=UPI0012F4E3C0|nr:phage capsid protein [Brachyspira pilosicoli]